MKKLHTLSLVLCSAISITGITQVNKGALFLGGSLSAGTYKDKYSLGTMEGKQTGFLISVPFGIAIKDNLIAGVNTLYSQGKSKNLNGSVEASDANAFYAGIFVRKYRAIGKSGFSLFMQGDLGWSHSRSEIENIGTRSLGTTSSITIGANPGISYAISRRFQLETGFSNLVSASYGWDKQTYYSGNTVTATDEGSGFNVSTTIGNANANFYFGFRVLLNKS
jgi:hypothetical protein